MGIPEFQESQTPRPNLVTFVLSPNPNPIFCNNMAQSPDSNFAKPEHLSRQLIKAVMDNDVFQLKTLREAGESLTSCDRNGNSLLHLAILGQTEGTTIDAFEYLLSLNEIPKEILNGRKNSVLFEAFSYPWDCRNFVTQLIQAGCDIHEKFKDGSTALHWALSNDWFEVAELLIEHGFDLNIKDSVGRTPLHLACDVSCVDTIWMLLFFGADPNLGCPSMTCFDLAADAGVRPQVRKIFFEQVIGLKKFNLQTFISVMHRDDLVGVYHRKEDFPVLLKMATDIDYSVADLVHFRDRISMFTPELFQMFLEKFDYVVEDVFRKCPKLSNAFRCKSPDKNLSKYIKNMFSLFESGIVGSLVDIIISRDIPVILYVLESFNNHQTHPAMRDSLFQLLCCLLSYGVNVTADAMNAIYLIFGYSDFFKILLHMDIEGINGKQGFAVLVSQIIYDVNTPLDYMISNISFYDETTLSMIFDYFALPKLVARCLNCYAYPPMLIERTENLPVVPCLVELARNCAREYIVKRFDIRNNRQFYTALKKLPIAEIYKQIIAFERKLYPLQRLEKEIFRRFY